VKKKNDFTILCRGGVASGVPNREKGKRLEGGGGGAAATSGRMEKVI